jgi:hypothetical protein
MDLEAQFDSGSRATYHTIRSNSAPPSTVNTMVASRPYVIDDSRHPFGGCCLDSSNAHLDAASKRGAKNVPMMVALLGQRSACPARCPISLPRAVNDSLQATTCCGRTSQSGRLQSFFRFSVEAAQSFLATRSVGISMASEQHCRCVPDSGRPPARLQLASGQPGAFRSKCASARAKNASDIKYADFDQSTR